MNKVLHKNMMRIVSYPAFSRYTLMIAQSMPSVAPCSLTDQQMAPAITLWVIGYPSKITNNKSQSKAKKICKGSSLSLLSLIHI